MYKNQLVFSEYYSPEMTIILKIVQQSLFYPHFSVESNLMQHF